MSTADIPTRTENAPIVGERSIHTLDDLKRHRESEVAFLLAKLVLEKYFTEKPWLFPQLLLLVEFAHEAADRIYKAIVESAAGTPALQEMPEVVRYVKNQSLGFTIPYTLNGEEKQYYPDFIAQVSLASRGAGPSGPADEDGLDGRSVRLQPDGLNINIEVTGEARKDKAAKVTTARTLWVPAVNKHGGFGRWAFVEVTDPCDAQRTMRAAVNAVGAGALWMRLAIEVFHELYRVDHCTDVTSEASGVCAAFHQMLGQELNVSAVGFVEDLHVVPRLLAFVMHLPLQLCEFLFRRQGWQNLLQVGEPAIDIFEMCINHRGVHRPQLLEKRMAASRPPS